MKDNTIILDLDDTLISTHERQYRCIHDYLISTGIKFIDLVSYINLRRSKSLSNTDLLNSLYPDLELTGLREFYLANIEDEKYLLFDKLIVEKKHLAEITKKKIKLVLLSLRSDHRNAEIQLHKMGIGSFFSELHFEFHDFNKNPKVARLSQLNTDNHIISFCGDSLSDYEAARFLNINFVQVKTSLYQLPDFEKAKQYININQYFLSIL